eukprot:s1827_g12.t1
MWQPSKSSKRRAIELPASFEVATRLGQQLKIEEQVHFQVSFSEMTDMWDCLLRTLAADPECAKRQRPQRIIIMLKRCATGVLLLKLHTFDACSK